MKRPTNSTQASTIATQEADAESWVTFDALPARVRRTLWEATVSISPASAAGYVAQGGERYAARALREAVDGELRMFAAEHRHRFGYDLPHAAAEVSLQPYS